MTDVIYKGYVIKPEVFQIDGDERYRGKWCPKKFGIGREIGGKLKFVEFPAQKEFYDTRIQATLRIIETAWRKIDEDSVGL